jgi:hypothetical protein
METTKVGIRELREKLAGYLESRTPVAITRHGSTIGIYVPTRPKPSQADFDALRIAGETMQELIEAAGTSEDEIAGFRKARRERRTRKADDANVLIRAVLGSRVLSLLRTSAGQIEFVATSRSRKRESTLPAF